MYIGVYVKYPLFLSDFNELEFSQQILEKYSNTKFRENPSSGSRVVPYGRTDRHDEANSLFFFLRKFLNSFPLKTQFLSKQILQLPRMAVMY